MEAIDLNGSPFDDDAPRVMSLAVIAVDLECHSPPQYGGGQLRPLGRSEDDRPVVHDEVDGKDVWLCRRGDGETADVGRAQQLPALVFGDDLSAGAVVGCHDSTLAPERDRWQGPSSPSSQAGSPIRVDRSRWDDRPAVNPTPRDGRRERPH